MAYDREVLASLLRSPRESLDVELKAWIDPSTPEGIAKIAKGCIALRNQNGGYFIVGIDDSGIPDPNVPSDVRALFRGDVIQAIVAKYSSHPFEVTIEFETRDGVTYPILCVPSGVETPVAAKAGLNDGDGKQLIRPDAVYVRSLNSNNTVSTTAARWRDWDRIVKICFDNREADIAAFIRRHLGGLNLQHLASALQNVRPAPTPTERASEYLMFGRKRFNDVCAQRDVRLPAVGTREAAIAIAGEVPPHSADEDFLNRMQASKPHHTGWTPWIDSRGGQNPLDQPYVFDGAWEALLADFADSAWGAHLDFWRIDPSGLFYSLRGFEDDLLHPRVEKPQPGTQLDFLLQISRVAEIISVGQSFARTMGCVDDATLLAITFRWAGLNGRHLTSWANPERHFYSRGVSHQNLVTTQVVVPLDAPQSVIPAHVETLVAPLFAVFGGMHFDSSVIAGIVRETLGRRF